jgi:hypothetical protein
MKFGKLSLDNENIRLLVIVAGIAVTFYFLYRYYNKQKSNDEFVDVDKEQFGYYEGFEDGAVTSAPGQMADEGVYDVQETPNNVPANMQANMQTNMPNNVQQNGMNNAQAKNYNIQPAEPWGMNEQPKGVVMSGDGVAPGQVPNECYPKDVLRSADLLPMDTNSVWAQVNPMGQGSLGDSNLLNSGYHVGIDTVGQTLRNASYDLRSEPPNPQVPVSPWNQTTIEPDINRRPFEIGGGM